MSEQIQRETYHENLTKLTPNQYWLVQHQITAFWHGFGISNGLDVPIEETETYTIPEYKGGPRKKYVRVKPAYMRKLLEEYLTWLTDYEKSWNNQSSDFDIKLYGNGFNDFLKNESSVHAESRLPILRMISLLQNNKPKTDLTQP